MTRWTGEANAFSWLVSLDLHWYKNIVMVSLTLTINQFDPGVSLGDKFSAFRNCNAELEGGSDFRRWPE